MRFMQMNMRRFGFFLVSSQLTPMFCHSWANRCLPARVTHNAQRKLHRQAPSWFALVWMLVAKQERTLTHQLRPDRANKRHVISSPCSSGCRTPPHLQSLGLSRLFWKGPFWGTTQMGYPFSGWFKGAPKSKSAIWAWGGPNPFFDTYPYVMPKHPPLIPDRPVQALRTNGEPAG